MKKMLSMLLPLPAMALLLSTPPAFGYEVTAENLRTLEAYFGPREGSENVFLLSREASGFREGYFAFSVEPITECRFAQLFITTRSASETISYFFYPTARRGFDWSARLPMALLVPGNYANALNPLAPIMTLFEIAEDRPSSQWFTALNTGQRRGVTRSIELLDQAINEVLAGNTRAADQTMETFRNLCDGNGELRE